MPGSQTQGGHGPGDGTNCYANGDGFRSVFDSQYVGEGAVEDSGHGTGIDITSQLRSDDVPHYYHDTGGRAIHFVGGHWGIAQGIRMPKSILEPYAGIEHEIMLIHYTLCFENQTQEEYDSIICYLELQGECK